MASITPYRGGHRAFVRRVGHPPSSKTFTGKYSKRAAEIWTRDEEGKIDRGEMFSPGVGVTFGGMLETYKTKIAAGRMGRSKQQALTALASHLGDLRLEELRPRAFIDFCQRREREGAGPSTILMDFSYISTVLRHASALHDAETFSVRALAALAAARAMLRHAGRLAKGRERDRRPTEPELRILRAHWALKGRRQIIPMWDIVIFAVATVMRLGEITRLRWEDFDPGAPGSGRALLENNDLEDDTSRPTILIRDRKDPRQKVGNDQRVPLLAGPAIILNEVIHPVAIMQRQASAKLSEGRIFPFSGQSISTAFTRAVAACGVDDLNFHDLRHDGVSRLFECGYTIPQVSLCSGHKTWASLKRYTNLRPEDLHKAKQI